MSGQRHGRGRGTTGRLEHGRAGLGYVFDHTERIRRWTVRVVVTGATGNIGSSVVEALADEPAVENIVGLARRHPQWNPAKTTFEAVDTRSGDLENVFAGADVVVHLAWAFQPTHDVTATWDVNVVGSMNVFEAARRAGVGSLVYASSVGAYAPGSGRRVDETWPTHSLPVAAYGREKSYLERYLDAFELRNPDLRVVRIRPSFVFKRTSASEQLRIFGGPLVPRPLLARGRLPVLPVPSGLAFQAVHAAELGEAFRRVVVGGAEGAFNVAADPVIDADVLGELLGAPPFTVPAVLTRGAVGAAWRLRAVPADEGLLRLLLSLPTMDVGRAQRELGWQPSTTGPEAVREMLDGAVDGAGGDTDPLHPA